MFNLDPSGVLLRVAGLSVLTGALWALTAAALIYFGSTRIPPKIRPGRVWAEWRRRRALWGLSLLLTLAGALCTAELIFRRIGMMDLYWATFEETIYRITWLGALSGYLLVLLLLVVVALRRPRRG